MKIRLAKSAGFCFGVTRAINLALKTIQSRQNVEMLGHIVHNEDVVKQIKAAGIKNIKSLKKGTGKTLLIRAHGAPKKIYRQAKVLGYSLVDATCPMVKEIHKIVREQEHRGYRIIIIGDHKHDEVLGILGQLKTKAIVIDRPEDIPVQKVRRLKKAAVVVQSTQNIEKVSQIVAKLRILIKNLKFFNTVCRPTQTKQAEIKTLPLENDVMIIIGSKHSANTKRLYQISKVLNARSYWIQSVKDIDRQWFKKLDTIGVTAGASTPDETTQNIVKYLRKLK